MERNYQADRGKDSVKCQLILNTSPLQPQYLQGTTLRISVGYDENNAIENQGEVDRFSSLELIIADTKVVITF